MVAPITRAREAYIERTRKFCERVLSEKGFVNQLADRWASGFIRGITGGVGIPAESSVLARARDRYIESVKGHCERILREEGLLQILAKQWEKGYIASLTGALLPSSDGKERRLLSRRPLE